MAKDKNAPRYDKQGRKARNAAKEIIWQISADSSH